MQNEIKVLIADNSADTGIKTASCLRNEGVYAYTRSRNGRVIFESIMKDAPDVVVCDLELPELDIIMLMKKVRYLLILRSQKTRKRCVVFIPMKLKH